MPGLHNAGATLTVPCSDRLTVRLFEVAGINALGSGVAVMAGKPLPKPSASALLLGLALAAPLQSALAQTPGPGALPAIRLPPQGSPIPRVLPPTLPQVGPGPVLPSATPAPAEGGQSFAIRSVRIDGATAYSPRVLAQFTTGLVGSAVPAGAIEAARQRLVTKYRADGYVYTAVSAVVSGDTLRFIVTEGRIASVKLQGDIGPAGTLVLRFLNHLTQLRPIDVASLERWLLLANDIPGVTVRSVLRPSADEPGALDLVAQVSRQAVSGLLTADNRAFQRTGPEELLAIGDLNSFTDLGERTEVTLYHTFDGTDTFGQASTEVFLGSSGLKLRVYGGAGDATPSGEYHTIGYNGFTTVFGGALSYPLIRARSQTLNLGLIFDALQSNIDTNTGADGAATRLSYDSLRVLRLGADYALQDNWAGGARPAVDGVSLRVSQGLPTLGASRSDAADAPRVSERTDFTKVTGELTRTQTLFIPWESASVTLLGLVTGQYSGDVLPPAEKFFLGGSRFTRGYYSGQVTGDSALAATAELQLNTPLPLPDFVPFDLSAQFYLFYDWGEAWQNLHTDPNQVLRSAGGGGRFYLTQYTEFDLEGVKRFTPDLTLTDQGSGVETESRSGGGAVYWRVLTRF
jgi:hemolysin activation/secretion protein